MPRSRCWIILALASVFATCASGELVTLEKPLYAEVYLKTDAARAPKIAGNLVSYDDTTLVIKAGKDEKSLNWSDLTPNSAFVLRQRLIDKTKPADWLELGRFGYSIGAKVQAKSALATAVNMDASLKPQATEIQAQAPTAPAETAKSADKPAEKTADKTGDKTGEMIQAGEGGTVVQPGRKKTGPQERIKFEAATPEQHAAALVQAREKKAKVESTLDAKLAEIETEHFVIFTDWDVREHNFLKKNFEDAYRVVSKQFDMSPKENIFVGKLPVYMWAKYDDFRRFAQQIDGFPVTQSIAGYYRSVDSGLGHMAMWKPNESLTGTPNIKDAERLWGYVLVHEFTHAFIARYRTNERIPRWLNEGVAEVIASSQIPYPERRQLARLVAVDRRDLSFLFDDDNMPSGQYYPVMQSLVELLVVTDRKGFIKFIDAIKDGTDPEDALKQIYKTNYADLTAKWRGWVVKQ